MNTIKTADAWIKKLKLLPHPEGGWYREYYRSTEKIPGHCLAKRFSGERNFSTAIYYLLKKHEYSRFHRLQSDEIWHFYSGAQLTLHLLSPQGQHKIFKLGPDKSNNIVFQAVIPALYWFGAMLDDGDYSLVGCTVAPGFDYKDIEFAARKELLAMYPEKRKIINRLTPATEK